MVEGYAKICRKGGVVVAALDGVVGLDEEDEEEEDLFIFTETLLASVFSSLLLLLLLSLSPLI